jgi:hypothetical protein
MNSPLSTIPTNVLESTRGAYLLNASSTLADLERLAILRAIEIELSDRAAAIKSGFACESEVNRLQILLEQKEEEIFLLKAEIDELGEKLEAAKKLAVDKENSTKLKAAG